jgi:hypothetical protein
MKGCAKFLAAICLLLFILSATLTLLFVNVRLYLLTEGIYIRALREAGVFEKLPAIVADQLRYGMKYNPCLEDPSLCEGEGAPEGFNQGQGGPPSYFANLPEEAWEEVLRTMVDPAWVESQVETVLNQVFSLLTEEHAQSAIAISMNEIKDRIGGGEGYQAVVEVIDAQPGCTPDQLLDLTEAIAHEGLSDIIVQCRPPGDLMNQVEPYIRFGLMEVVGELPSIIEIDIPGQMMASDRGVTTILSILRATFRFAPWITSFWLMAVTVIAVRDLRSWLGWWGTGLFTTGLSGLVVGFALGPFLGWSVDRFLVSQGPGGVSPMVMDIALDVFNRVIGSFSSRVLTQAGIILAIGLLMLIVRLFTRRPSNGQIGAQLTEPR